MIHISACKSEYRIPSLFKSMAIWYQISPIPCSCFSDRKHPITRGFFVFILFFHTGLVPYTWKIVPGYHLGHANQTHMVCRVITALKKTITELQENICFSYIKYNAVKQIARVKSLTWRPWKDQSSPKPNDRC